MNRRPARVPIDGKIEAVPAIEVTAENGTPMDLTGCSFRVFYRLRNGRIECRDAIPIAPLTDGRLQTCEPDLSDEIVGFELEISTPTHKIHTLPWPRPISGQHQEEEDE